MVGELGREGGEDIGNDLALTPRLHAHRSTEFHAQTMLNRLHVGWPRYR
jgi:hypothetical protein